MDNTFVSCLAHDIKCENIFPLLQNNYQFAITEDVVSEGVKRFNEIVEQIHQNVKVFSFDDKCKEINSYLMKRYPGLDLGESTTIVASIMMTRSGFENYIITDDYGARNTIPKLHENLQLEELLGFPVVPIRYTGTAGFLIHMKKNRKIAADLCVKISKDFRSGSFRLPSALIDELGEPAI